MENIMENNSLIIWIVIISIIGVVFYTIYNKSIVASQVAASQVAASQVAASQVAASQVAASQVAASQAMVSQIAASQVAASQSAVSQVAASQVAASQVAASQVAASQVAVSQIAASQVAAEKAVVSQIAASQVAASQAVVSQIAASQAIVSQIAASQVAASQAIVSQLAASQVAASQVAASQVAASQVAASQVAASQVAASQVAASQVAASQVAASQVAASQVAASQVAASQVAASQAVVSQVAASQVAASQAAVPTIVFQTQLNERITTPTDFSTNINFNGKGIAISFWFQHDWKNDLGNKSILTLEGDVYTLNIVADNARMQFNIYRNVDGQLRLIKNGDIYGLNGSGTTGAFQPLGHPIKEDGTYGDSYIPIETMRHVVWTIDPTYNNWNIYFDGFNNNIEDPAGSNFIYVDKTNTQNKLYPINLNITDIYVGYSKKPLPYIGTRGIFNGQLINVQVYTGLLSSSFIKKLYNNQKGFVSTLAKSYL